jgi:hypothetical protein
VEHECRARPRVLDPGAALVAGGDVSHDGEAEAVAREEGVEAVEGLEDGRALGGGHAGALDVHGEAPARVLGAQGEGDAAAVGALAPPGQRSLALTQGLSPGPAPGDPDPRLRAGAGLFAGGRLAMSEDRPNPIEDGPPEWASSWGEDRCGVFVGFEVGGVEQILRWIPPGTFEMGSPEGEQGRSDHEGPQHEVTISRGFWLGETPVTQALWKAVMGDNPSRFVDALRPVERLDVERVEAFMTEMEERIPGLGLRLPSEAEWEYACRAGTTDATYEGPVKILGERNAPVLDALAWYGGNSGVG